jgi:simple sugar transport system permease protein
MASPSELLASLSPRVREEGIILSSFLLALLLGAGLFALLGADPLEAYWGMLRGAFGSSESALSTLARAVPLVLSALSISTAFSAGVWNIGAEGQLYVGAFAAAFAGFALPALPHLPMLLVVGALGVLAGALWAYLPGRMAQDLDMNLVVLTIMLNSVALLATDWLATGPFAAPEETTGSTPQILAAARFAKFSGLSALHTGVFWALLAAGGVIFLSLFTVFGYECRMIRLNARFAAYGGVDVRGRRLTVMTLSGALAGLAGTLLVMGDHYRFLTGISPGYTWTGMILAMMVCYHPVGATAAALLYAAMSSGALEMELLTDVPSEVVEIIMTSAVLFVTAGLSWADRLADRIRED